MEDYDPNKPTMDIQTADLTELLTQVQHSFNTDIVAFLHTVPIPLHAPKDPWFIHMLLTANVCHYYTAIAHYPLMPNYQDFILDYLFEIGYEHYALWCRMNKQAQNVFLFS